MFGRNDAAFRAAVVEIIEKHYGKAYTIAELPSKQAAYLSLTVTVRAESRAQIDALYQDFVVSPHVLMAL